jgi:hypothetical protein
MYWYFSILVIGIKAFDKVYLKTLLNGTSCLVVNLTVGVIIKTSVRVFCAVNGTKMYWNVLMKFFLDTFSPRKSPELTKNYNQNIRTQRVSLIYLKAFLAVNYQKNDFYEMHQGCFII